MITGRGGLPPTPRETVSDDTVLEDWGTRTLAAASSPRGENAPSGSSNSTAADVTTAPIDPSPIPFVEAQGWVYGPHGEVILTATPPTLTPQNAGVKPATCPQS